MQGSWLSVLVLAVACSRGGARAGDAAVADSPADAADATDASDAGGFTPGSRITLADGWTLQSSAVASAPGEAISSPGFDTTAWHRATVPSTLVGALVADGTLPDPYFGKNLLDFPGMKDAAGNPVYPVGGSFSYVEIPDSSPFKPPWWYRTEVDLPALPAGGRVWLDLDGVNFRANVWVNGRRVADDSTVAGTYRYFELDLTDTVRPGANAIAIAVSAPLMQDLAHNWVDWNPTPPDKGAGLWRPASLRASGPVTVRHPYVVAKVGVPAEGQADLTVKADIRNATGDPVTADVAVRIEGGLDIDIHAPVSLGPGEERTISFGRADFPALVAPQAQWWWPVGMGDPVLHPMTVTATVGGRASDEVRTLVGVRETASELTATGSRLFRVNGLPVFIHGAEWARDMLFMETPDREDREVRLLRNLGLNAVRFEGKFGSDHLMDLFDAAGILVIPGWCCCDIWQEQWAWSDEDHAVARASMRDQALAMRGRAGVLTFLYGSDEAPNEDIERGYLDALEGAGWPNPAQASASQSEGPATGPTGLKMLGPYEWVPPNYWYEDTARGGAWGFATEIGPGPSPPEPDGLLAMLGDAHMWPQDDVWGYHCAEESYQNLDVFTAAMTARLGAPTGVVDFSRKAQLMAYEGHRAMFEAYSRNRYTKATGVVQWMLNVAWPSLIWHLYGHDLGTGGAYYGAKEANSPLHALYAPDDRSVWLVNGTPEAETLVVRVRALDVGGTVSSDRSFTAAVPADGLAKVAEVETQPGAVTWLLRLDVADQAGVAKDASLYWLSTTPDVLAWDKADDTHTPTASYADLTGLAAMPQAAVELAAARLASGETAADEEGLRVTVRNPTDKLAFFVRLKVLDGGKEVRPTMWQGNFVSLLAGEERSLTVTWRRQDQPAGGPVVSAEGWNVPPVTSGL